MSATISLGNSVGKKAACNALDIPRATHQVEGTGKMDVLSLYVILDVFSRYVVGWMVAHRESATLAKP